MHEINYLEQWTIASLETPTGKPHDTHQKLYLISSNTAALSSCHISIDPLKAINHAISNNLKLNTLIEIEENPSLAIEQPDLVIIPMLQKLRPRIPNVYMALSWNPGGQTVILKRKMTISYERESDYREKSPQDQ